MSAVMHLTFNQEEFPLQPGLGPYTSSCLPIVDNVTMSSIPNYRGYRFPPQIISHAVWLYHRFTFRDPDLMDSSAIPICYS